jgi:lipoprotein-anchoring transpeptidase ErfK/SrfK
VSAADRGLGRTSASPPSATGAGAAVADLSGPDPVALRRATAPVPAGTASSVRPSQPSLPPRPRPALLVRIPHSLPITSRPGGGRTIGVMPARSKYLGAPITAWVLEVGANGRFGRVTVPYSGTNATGWIPLRGLARSTTPYSVHVDLSRHELTLWRFGVVVMRVPAATGAPRSPTPPGRYFVTDRVDTRPWPAFGSFAFGLSGIQTHLPPGWRGGDQLAIHGTNDPAAIGLSVSAGCLHVSEATLARLRPLLLAGTPVVIAP